MDKGKDGSLDTLLDLDGEIFPMDNGYWVKFSAKSTDPNPNIPHGVRYSMTLHDRYNNRVVGFDNAHAVKPARKKGLPGERSHGITSTI